ncbi:DUF1772 domain-containing protein [Amycolatopsis nalaikhensis]|uniref:DUF1772 domain-containing protein n=1 Tax=Amycolatopsis nalaikhensis TaxID=715472 RepID=A0ABY8XJK0_9PSEU|nr:DUF1772 domain-containing protein [Amycolatopsis sp. 2-2]WIV55814.1 DUF1772 domain-containing protein [Amycolatopsis sp. 2-2]
MRTLALAATAAFAGGALLTQTVIVPSWRAAPPEVFLARFATEGPITGATVFPFELASLVLLALSIRGSSARWWWAAATVCSAGTFVLLLYFVPANLALLDPAFPPRDVAGALAAWNRWDWLRTGLGVAATAFAVGAQLSVRAERRR